MIDFKTHPDKYNHWSITTDGQVATLTMNVNETAALVPGYELKLNSYDLSVDIELYDAVQRLRFEHPEVKSVIVTSGKEKVFCSGANITMLGQSSHQHKVNFCKFTNETRNSLEDASENSQLKFISAVNGTAAGGGYELALATDYIILVDDGNSAVSLPEVPLLAVLPGTGGLTRVVDKRHVRRDHADFFCTINEGIKGKRAVDWRLVDEIAPLSKLNDIAHSRAQEFAAGSDRPDNSKGVILTDLNRTFSGDEVAYDTVKIKIERKRKTAELTVHAPTEETPMDVAAIEALGVNFWPLALARDLDDAILHLRANEIEIGTWIFRTSGDAALIETADQSMLNNSDNWFIRETTLFLKRVFKRIDVTSRSLFALVEPGSCFTGTLMELVLCADRSYMLDGTIEGDHRPAPILHPTGMNFGPLLMCNGLTRLQTRFLKTPERIEAIRDQMGKDLDTQSADALGLVTFTPDDLDWEDEVRIAIEERASFSPDALTGMEASLRFAGPETIETKIFGRLSAWQNWIFQRPNAVGTEGALKLFGSGQQATFDQKRV